MRLFVFVHVWVSASVVLVVCALEVSSSHSLVVLEFPNPIHFVHSDPKDPFNRSPLKLDMVIPQSELRDRILEWMDENGIKMTDRYTSKDCTG